MMTKFCYLTFIIPALNSADFRDEENNNLLFLRENKHR
ncbi:hypothetical protein BN1221_05042c [Brenneria goodwinii]|uniref:Uncharacterized protein n=1 Tax=Brenneria goodwinii TaxID=1109412 RepID=A0A0G4K375_9GAMM|nr:hypothetical protein BN1221_05042c [Brenneria goodwinii]